MEGVNIYIDPITLVSLQQGKIAVGYFPHVGGNVALAITDRTEVGLEVVRPVLPLYKAVAEPALRGG